MRCFVAAILEADSARGLQEAYRARCSTERDALRLRDVPTGNYHVTLRFLGEVDEVAVSEILHAVADLRGTDTLGTALGFVGFPRAAATRVVVAQLAEQENLRAWSARLEELLGPGDRPFRPHVTVARAQRPCRFAPLPLEPPLPLALHAPRLYRSDTTPRGPQYRAVSAADLKRS